MADTPPPRLPRCSFCGKDQDTVKCLIAAPGVYICDDCVDLCCEILEEKSEGAFRWQVKPVPVDKPWPVPTPPAKTRWGFDPSFFYSNKRETP